MFKRFSNKSLFFGMALLLLAACALPVPGVQNALRTAVPVQGGGSAALTPPAAAVSPSAWKFPNRDNTSFRTYRAHLLFTVALPDDGQQYPVMEMQDEVVTGQAEHMLISEQDSGVEMEIIVIGDKAWMRSAGGNWLLIGSDQVEQIVTSPESYLPDFTDAHWENAGTVTADGLQLYHYVLDLTQYIEQAEASNWFYTASSVVPELAGATYAIDEGKSEVYVLPGGLIFKSFYTLAGTATLADGSTKKVQMHNVFEITDVNADIQITPPPKSEGASAEAPFPLPPNATVVASTQGMQIFSVPGATLDEVMAFFDENLPAAGFTITNKFGSAESGYTMTISGNGKTYTTIVAADEGAVSISIMNGG